MNDLSRLNISEALLGVFWGVWFAQLSHTILGAQSDISLSTGQLRAAYVIGALASVLSFTTLLVLLQFLWQKLTRQVTDGAADGPAIVGSVVSLLFSVGLIALIIVSLPFASYAFFKDVSLAEVALSALVVPVWLVFIMTWGLIGLANVR